MSYLEEIQPYRQRIQLHLEGKGFIPRVVQEELTVIYDKLRKEESIKIYGKPNIIPPPVDLGCGTCINIMLRDLSNWIRIKENDKTVPFKAIVDKKAVEVIEEEMSWGTFKSYCKSKHINTKGKKRVELEEELKAL